MQIGGRTRAGRITRRLAAALDAAPSRRTAVAFSVRCPPERVLICGSATAFVAAGRPPVRGVQRVRGGGAVPVADRAAADDVSAGTAAAGGAGHQEEMASAAAHRTGCPSARYVVGLPPACAARRASAASRSTPAGVQPGGVQILCGEGVARAVEVGLARPRVVADRPVVEEPLQRERLGAIIRSSAPPTRRCPRGSAESRGDRPRSVYARQLSSLFVSNTLSSRPIRPRSGEDRRAPEASSMCPVGHAPFSTPPGMHRVPVCSRIGESHPDPYDIPFLDGWRKRRGDTQSTALSDAMSSDPEGACAAALGMRTLRSDQAGTAGSNRRLGGVVVRARPPAHARARTRSVAMAGRRRRALISGTVLIRTVPGRAGGCGRTASRWCGWPRSGSWTSSKRGRPGRRQAHRSCRSSTPSSPRAESERPLSLR